VDREKESRRLVEEFVISKCSAKAFSLKKGQILRAISHEGKQVADIKFFNAHDYREQVAAWWSSYLNSLEGIGGSKKLRKLYSKPPWERVMLTVVDDKVGDHLLDGSCSPMLEVLNPEGAPVGGKTCVDLFADCLKPYGLSLEDVDSSGTFNVFMPIRFGDDENGPWIFLPPSCEVGDYIDFRAEINVLVAATSCPQANVINNFQPKAMKYQIYEE
jgi:uncharacterized protein YcgI (DUF1989 family)